MKKKILIGFVLFVLLGTVVASGSYLFLKWQRIQKEEVPQAVDIDQIIQKAQSGTGSQATLSSDIQNTSVGDAQHDQKLLSENIAPRVLPPELNLKMDFYSQAPFGDWSYPWQGACEEASILLVANTYHKHQWTREQFNEQILQLVKWEKENFGSYEHTDMVQTEQILNQYLNLKTQIHENPTYKDIQQILAQGHFIIMPVAGKQVKNPFYKNGGPIYHVFVVKGYKEGQKLITHDVGTRNGENYVYQWEILEKALHDYAEPIDAGPKKIIEVFPPEVSNKPKA